MQATKLYQTMSMQELTAMQEQLSADPANRNTDGGIFIHNAVTRKKLDAIARAITWHMEDKRAAAGNPVPTSGYSGRNSKRR